MTEPFLSLFQNCGITLLHVSRAQSFDSLIQYWSCLHSLWVLIWIFSSVVISWQCVLCIKIEVQLFKHCQWCYMWVCSNYIKTRTRHLVLFFFFCKELQLILQFFNLLDKMREATIEQAASMHVVAGPLRDYILTYFSTGYVTSLYVFISLLWTYPRAANSC